MVYFSSSFVNFLDKFLKSVIHDIHERRKYHENKAVIPGIKATFIKYQQNLIYLNTEKAALFEIIQTRPLFSLAAGNQISWDAILSTGHDLDSTRSFCNRRQQNKDIIDLEN